jgi:hypothetical protein
MAAVAALGAAFASSAYAGIWEGKLGKGQSTLYPVEYTMKAVLAYSEKPEAGNICSGPGTYSGSTIMWPWGKNCKMAWSDWDPGYSVKAYPGVSNPQSVEIKFYLTWS